MINSFKGKLERGRKRETENMNGKGKVLPMLRAVSWWFHNELRSRRIYFLFMIPRGFLVSIKKKNQKKLALK